MSIERLLTQTVTIVRRSFDAVDQYGSPQPGSTTSAVWPARLESLTSTETIRDRDVVVADWRVFLPAAAQIGPFDQVVESDRTFEVWGDPIERRAPRGVHHLEVRLRRIT